jgi:hypothetical protein
MVIKIETFPFIFFKRIFTNVNHSSRQNLLQNPPSGIFHGAQALDFRLDYQQTTMTMTCLVNASWQTLPVHDTTQIFVFKVVGPDLELFVG